MAAPSRAPGQAAGTTEVVIRAVACLALVAAACSCDNRLPDGARLATPAEQERPGRFWAAQGYPDCPADDMYVWEVPAEQIPILCDAPAALACLDRRRKGLFDVAVAVVPLDDPAMIYLIEHEDIHRREYCAWGWYWYDHEESGEHWRLWFAQGGK